MTPRGLPYGRGSYKGPDSNLSQQESYAIRRELNPKEGGWVIRSALNSSWSVGGHLGGHTTGTLYLVSLPLFYNTFELSEARIRVGGAVANKTLKSGIYIYNSEPKRQFKLIASSEIVFDLGTVGLITRPLANKPRMVALKRYFVGTIIDDAVASLLSTQSNQTTDEATISFATTDLPGNLSLSATTKAYPTQLPMPSYFSKDAAEVL